MGSYESPRANAGFSLPSLVTTMALVGILLTVVVSVLLNMNSVMSRLEAKEHHNNLAEEIRRLWSQEVYCMESFKDIRFNRNSTEATPQIISMANRQLAATPFGAYQPGNLYQLREVRLARIAGPFEDRYMARARLIFQPRRSSTLTFRAREITLSLQTDATDTIIHCSTDPTIKPPIRVIETPVVSEIYLYPDAKLPIPITNLAPKWHIQSIEAICPQGYKVYNCLGGLGAVGTNICTAASTSAAAYDAEGGADDHAAYVFNIYNKRTSCQFDLFGWFTDKNEAYYQTFHNRRFCIKAQCVPLTFE